MKKFFTFVFIALVGFAAFGQLPSNPFSVLQKSAQRKADTVYQTWYLHDSTYEYQYDTSAQNWELNSKTINYYTGRYYHAVEEYSKDSTGNFQMQSQHVYTRDTLNRITVQESRFSMNGIVTPYNLDSITYLGTTNLETEILNLSYDTASSSWVYARKSQYTYNSNNLRTEWLQQYWASNQWMNQFKYIYAYDSNDNLISKLYKTWDGSQWVDNSKELYSYDSNGNFTSKVYLRYNTTTQTYDTTYKEVYTYNSSNQMTVKVTTSYQNGQAIPMDSTVYVYNNGLLTSDTTFRYDTASSAWHYRQLGEFSYNSNGDPVEYIIQGWDGSQWVKLYKFAVTYTLNQPVEKSVSPSPSIFEGLKSVPDMMEISQWKNNAWQPAQRSRYYFSSYTDWYLSDVPSLEVQGLRIYPNPARDYLVVDMNGSHGLVQIICMNGQIVKSLRTTGNIIPVGDLPRGLYIVKLTRDNQTFVGKMIKQ